MRDFLRKTRMVGIIAIAVPLLIIISIFFPDGSHIELYIFLVAVSILQLIEDKIDPISSASSSVDLIKWRKKFGHSMLVISLLYGLLLLVFKNHLIIISYFALACYVVNALLLYKKVRNIDK